MAGSNFSHSALATRLLTRTMLGSPILIAALATAQQAEAQAQRAVSACSGASLPRSAVTDILRPVITGIATPTETLVNSILNVPLLGLLGSDLNLNATGLLDQAANGDPISLNVLTTDGTILGPGEACRATSDSITLTAPAGVAIGGNQITGLGANGAAAFASDINAIAFGNNARAEAGATGSLALGSNANVTAANSVALGAGSTAARGALANYAALGVTGAQNSAGEVSVGTAGGLRQITNVAAGTAASDAATVGQLQGVANQITAIGTGGVQYDDPAVRDRVTLTGATGTVIGNVAAGAVTATSTEAVNGSQLFATNQQVAINTGAIATNAAAIGNVDARVTVNTAAITDIDTRVTNNTTLINDVAANAVRYDNAGKAIVTFGGAGGTVLANVAAGELSTTSTQAVNGAQLNATNQVVAGIDTRVTNNTTRITNLGDTVTDLGTQVTTNTTNITNLGDQVTDLAANAVQYSDATRSNVDLAGAAGTTISNVAAGQLSATSTQAVNGAQLFATNQQVTANTTNITNLGDQIGDIGANAIRYNDATRAAVTLGGATGTVIDNVAAGALTATSTQAVNGGQLFATNQRVDANSGAITNIDARVTTNTTAITDLGTQVTNNTNIIADLGANAVRYDDVGRGTITLGGAGGTRVTNVTAGGLTATSTDAVNGAQLFATNQQVAAINTTINNGAVGALRYSNPGTPTTPNGGTVTDDTTLVGASAGPVGLHNVRDGALAAGSTDAVNGGQLFATNTQVATNTGAITSIDARVTVNTTDIANLSTEVTNNSTAITNLQNNVAGTNTTVTNLQTQVTNNTNSITNLGDQVTTLAANAIQYDDATRANVTLAGTNGTTIDNVAAGQLSATSSQAVNGSQLFATNEQVGANTTAITNLNNTIAGSTVTAVQYSNADTPTTPNGGTRTNDVTLVGVDTNAPVALHNVAGGTVSATSTDAVNGQQLYAVSTQASNSVQYDRTAGGGRGNTLTLAGGEAGAVTINNVANGSVAAGSTQAVNGGQLYATAQVAAQAAALGANSVQYDAGNTSVTFNSSGSAVVLRNVAAGTATTDAVNVGQLQSGLQGAVAASMNYTDQRLGAALESMNFNLRGLRKDLRAGSSTALAAAALPQATEPGRSMVAMGTGTYGGEVGVAFGASTFLDDGHSIVRLGATVDSRGKGGANAGIGYQF